MKSLLVVPQALMAAMIDWFADGNHSFNYQKFVSDLFSLSIDS